MGQTSLHDYTIQADVRGAKKDGKLPDIALTAQRYTLDLMGDHQQLEIRTWISQPERLVARFPFVWEADVWYTLKFRAAVENEQAVLQGKVWKRGEAEPAEWQVSVTDTIPSVIGSPGLFGSAKDAELFYDNLTVTNNK